MLTVIYFAQLHLCLLSRHCYYSIGKASDHPTTINTTYNLNDHHHIIDETQTDTLVVPDTMVNLDTQLNDSSWQRDIDRLMKKLEEPSTSTKSQTQIQQTQHEEEMIEPLYLSQTGKTRRQSAIEVDRRQVQTTTTIQTDEIGIQTDLNANSSSLHDCCQDVSMCPCVLVSCSSFIFVVARQHRC